MSEENKDKPYLVTDVNADGLLIRSAQAVREANQTIQENEKHLKQVRQKLREFHGKDLHN